MYVFLILHTANPVHHSFHLLHAVVRSVHHLILPLPTDTLQMLEPNVVAIQLASLSANMFSANLAGTPLAQQLNKEGRGLSPMQDVGDNTALVAYVLP